MVHDGIYTYINNPHNEHEQTKGRVYYTTYILHYNNIIVNLWLFTEVWVWNCMTVLMVVIKKLWLFIINSFTGYRDSRILIM